MDLDDTPPKVNGATMHLTLTSTIHRLTVMDHIVVITKLIYHHLVISFWEDCITMWYKVMSGKYVWFYVKD